MKECITFVELNDHIRMFGYNNLHLLLLLLFSLLLT